MMIYMLVGFKKVGFIEFVLNLKDVWFKCVMFMNVGCRFYVEVIVVIMFEF